MTQLDLFGKEAEKIVKTKRKRAVIKIGYGNYSCDGEKFKKGQQYISVDFWGHNEGSASPCDSEQEANEHIKHLLERHKDDYDIKIIDERVKLN
jgi:hypothetical protein